MIELSGGGPFASPGKNVNWIVIKIVNGLAEAHIIKGFLEANNIPVKLDYEAIGQIYGLTVDGLGQVKILVPEEYFEEAEKLLAD